MVVVAKCSGNSIVAKSFLGIASYYVKIINLLISTVASKYNRKPPIT